MLQAWKSVGNHWKTYMFVGVDQKFFQVFIDVHQTVTKRNIDEKSIIINIGPGVTS